ncbi:hypothetical protein [Arthrobacter sp. BE255]|uniref:hypothetical protein n=1 Tax=Arthrobacter sp. BE255 TaxID=2817721 RepID=UPI002866FD38|nr:hypothetical protein [Arthrobacter sp. BE255]MDR7160752.1 hypothetical protein [Arthrobacter sp. BE255]
MTPQASRLTDTVESMLLDAGQEQDTELRAALLSLGTLASLPAPVPNAQLAALLASRPDELTRRRRQRRHRNRSAIVGLAVVAGMGLGVTGVAASASGPAGKASLSVQHLLEDWAPPWNVSGLPAAAPAIGTVPEPAPVEPGPAQDLSTADSQKQYVPDQPAAPDTTPDRTAEAEPNDGGADAQAGSGSAGASGGAKNPKEQGQLPEVSHSQEAGQSTEPVRQSLEKTEKLLADVVPGKSVSKEAGNGSGKSGSGKKTDPGAKWLKKFSR